jgi:hypothetical protein
MALWHVVTDRAGVEIEDVAEAITYYPITRRRFDWLIDASEQAAEELRHRVGFRLVEPAADGEYHDIWGEADYWVYLVYRNGRKVRRVRHWPDECA